MSSAVVSHSPRRTAPLALAACLRTTSGEQHGGAESPTVWSLTLDLRVLSLSALLRFLAPGPGGACRFRAAAFELSGPAGDRRLWGVFRRACAAA
eukprot:9226716-Pyramimonas_sp.AAC.1